MPGKMFLPKDTSLVHQHVGLKSGNSNDEDEYAWRDQPWAASSLIK